MCALNIDKGGGWVPQSLLGSHAHNILNSLVKELSGHDHTISSAIVRDNFKYCASRHDI